MGNFVTLAKIQGLPKNIVDTGIGFLGACFGSSKDPEVQIAFMSGFEMSQGGGCQKEEFQFKI